MKALLISMLKRYRKSLIDSEYSSDALIDKTMTDSIFTYKNPNHVECVKTILKSIRFLLTAENMNGSVFLKWVDKVCFLFRCLGSCTHREEVLLHFFSTVLRHKQEVAIYGVEESCGIKVLNNLLETLQPYYPDVNYIFNQEWSSFNNVKGITENT